VAHGARFVDGWQDLTSLAKHESLDKLEQQQLLYAWHCPCR